MMKPDFTIEQFYFKRGYGIIAGVDEAGRGALAGPLSVSLVAYDLSKANDLERSLSMIDDSKKMSPRKREEALKVVESNSLFHALFFVSHSQIDSSNINIATADAIVQLLASCKVKPDLLLLDGNFKFDLAVESVSIIKGDSKSLSIASASILAKVRRDNLMKSLDREYEGYGFAQHFGYGTKLHRDSIARLGPCPIHRMTYAPMKYMTDMEGMGEG